MKSLFGHITKSLAGKLVIAIGLIIMIGGGISWYILLSAGKRNLINDAIRNTASYSDLIKKSIQYSMLTFHRESVQETINSVGSAENIKGVRIFDSKGKIFYSSSHKEIGLIADRGSPACRGCHFDPENPSITIKTENQWVMYTDSKGYRLLTFIDPIYNETSCYTADCHVHPQNQRVLGILETNFSLTFVDDNIRKQTINITIYAFVFMSISSVILYFVLRRFVLKPVSTLSSAMNKVSEGDLEHKAFIDSNDEMRLLADTFNLMTEDLKTARKKMKKWTETLEDEVARKTRELRNSQERLIQAEKLASIGRLTADVAHEIRNPLTAIGGFARRLRKIVTGTKEKEYTEVMISEVNRLEKILRDVLIFSREAKFNFEINNLELILTKTLKVYQDLLNEHSIDLKIEIEEDIPDILIEGEQLMLALGNLITNAIDAMPQGGMIKATIDKKDFNYVTYIVIKISDTGQGIPEEKLPIIFEPFYSTKEIGRGTGLGLSITRKIIEEHGGFIKAESTLGLGSSFSLYLPYQSEEESLKIKCWEYMKCGRDKDATIKCPAYSSFGRMCWAAAGTFCEGKVQGTFAQKFEDCRKCPFYQKRIKGEI